MKDTKELKRESDYQEFLSTFIEELLEINKENMDYIIDIMYNHERNFNNCDPTTGQRVWDRGTLEKYCNVFINEVEAEKKRAEINKLFEDESPTTFKDSVLKTNSNRIELANTLYKILTRNKVYYTRADNNIEIYSHDLSMIYRINLNNLANVTETLSNNKICIEIKCLDNSVLSLYYDLRWAR